LPRNRLRHRFGYRANNKQTKSIINMLGLMATTQDWTENCRRSQNKLGVQTARKIPFKWHLWSI